MAHASAPRVLAVQLARAAHDLAQSVGDVEAQIKVYCLLLRRWEAGLSEHIRNAPGNSSVERILDDADVDAVAQHYRDLGMDPAVYFYEEFVRACDATDARTRGVRYSPPQLVSFMLRAAEHLMRIEFGQTIAEAVVVDPCCGAGTFLKDVHRRFWPPPPTIGVEISHSASAVASLLLPESEIVCGDWLGDFGVDTDGRTLVVVGNPPYSGHSANPGKVRTLMADYRVGLTERNPKWLQDDYVKFIRMAQHHVERTGKGMVVFVTNHSYLSNPTFRAMRASLMRDFDQIYVVDLQGNSRRNQVADEPDQNVFPIRMGVAISVMIRHDSSPTSSTGRKRTVSCVQVRGSRTEKLEWLAKAQFDSIEWTNVAPAMPLVLFQTQNHSLRKEYSLFRPLVELFHEHSVGFVTSRDAFAVDMDKDALLARIAVLRDSNLTPEQLRADYPVGDLAVERTQRILRADRHWQDRAVPVLYRPFDVRWAYYSPEIMERPRLPFMRHMMAENVSIVVGRAGNATGSRVWDVAFCADCPTDLNLFRRGGATILPRYRYENGTRRDNIAAPLFDASIFFDYIYAIIWSGEYRLRYADFLSFDYPRIPIPSNETDIRDLARLGRTLMELHLMRRPPISAGSGGLTVGGYSIPDKYVADRRGMELSREAEEHVEWIRKAAAETVAIQTKIDSTIRSKRLWDA